MNPLRSKRWLALLLFAQVLLLAGCLNKTIYPAVLLIVDSVEPYQLVPTATDTASLPTVSVTLVTQSRVPAYLKGFSVSYTTNLGEPLPYLTIEELPLLTTLQVSGSTQVTVPVYSSRVVDLFELSPSSIAPIKATITLRIQDANHNTIFREALCLLYPIS
jgi:hypothetical protein